PPVFAVQFQPAPAATQLRFQFNIAANTPLKDLLPEPPKVNKRTGPVLVEDLAQVPEVEFQAPPTKKQPSEAATRNVAFMIAKPHPPNGKKPAGSLERRAGERPALAGLPFAMGDACRTKGERSKQFALAVATVRRALQPQAQAAPQAANAAPAPPA